MVQDSQGRRLVVRTDLDKGDSAYSVEDPIAGASFEWTTNSRVAKMLRYPEPVAGRRSCWIVAPEERRPAPGDARIVGFNGIICEPAERRQPAFCMRPENSSNVLVRSPSDDPLIPEASYKDCLDVREAITLSVFAGETDEQDEDLGSDTIKGFATHVCRITTKLKGRTIVRESWIARFGARESSVSLGLRRMAEEPLPLPSMLTIKRSEEVVSLNLEEPDVTTFQPPMGYEIKTVEVQEVPCEEPRSKSVSPLAQGQSHLH